MIPAMLAGMGTQAVGHLMNMIGSGITAARVASGMRTEISATRAATDYTYAMQRGALKRQEIALFGRLNASAGVSDVGGASVDLKEETARQAIDLQYDQIEQQKTAGETKIAGLETALAQQNVNAGLDVASQFIGAGSQMANQIANLPEGLFDNSEQTTEDQLSMDFETGQSSINSGVARWAKKFNPKDKIDVSGLDMRKIMDPKMAGMWGGF